jgi:hypothetical protein
MSFHGSTFSRAQGPTERSFFRGNLCGKRGLVIHIESLGFSECPFLGLKFSVAPGISRSYRTLCNIIHRIGSIPGRIVRSASNSRIRLAGHPPCQCSQGPTRTKPQELAQYAARSPPNGIDEHAADIEAVLFAIEYPQTLGGQISRKSTCGARQPWVAGPSKNRAGDCAIDRRPRVCLPTTRFATDSVNGALHNQTNHCPNDCANQNMHKQAISVVIERR